MNELQEFYPYVEMPAVAKNPDKFKGSFDGRACSIFLSSTLYRVRELTTSLDRSTSGQEEEVCRDSAGIHGESCAVH